MKANFFHLNFSVFFSVIGFSLCLFGCVSSSQTLYSWESYEAQVYAYLKGEGRDALILALERDKEKIESSGKAAPPGFYAQLGLLYAETGDAAMAIAYFETEKALFPEADTYMDFILGQLQEINAAH